MHRAATLTTASVGCSMTGSGTSSTRMSPGPWIVVARMLASLQCRESPRPPLACRISHMSYRGRMTEGYKGRIGSIIRDARKHRGLTQQQLAERLSTSQSAINRIEKGHQNLSLDMLARIGSGLDSEIVALGAGPTHLRVTGPTRLSGSIDVKTSKNAGVALLCASLLNKGRTTLRKVARIE